MEKTFTAVCQAISITKNNSGVRFNVPAADPKQPGELIVISALSEADAKLFSAEKKYNVIFSEITE